VERFGFLFFFFCWSICSLFLFFLQTGLKKRKRECDNCAAQRCKNGSEISHINGKKSKKKKKKKKKCNVLLC
jgi:hypothetical protein